MVSGGPERIRTSNPGFGKTMLYPLSYRPTPRMYADECTLVNSDQDLNELGGLDGA